MQRLCITRQEYFGIICCLLSLGKAQGTLSRVEVNADDFERLLVPFTWKDTTEDEIARRLQHHSGIDTEHAFVQRSPSETSRVFELMQGSKALPAKFDDSHHGLTVGSLIKLPVCAFRGQLHTFQLRNSGLIPLALQEKIINIRSYHAFEVGGSMSAEITIGPEGIRAQIWVGGSEHTICYIDPHTIGRADKYTMYSHVDPRMKDGTPEPHTLYSEIKPPLADSYEGLRRLNSDQSPGNISRRLADASFNIHLPPDGQQSYRTYRICVAVSPDYLTFAASRQTTAMSMLTTTFTRAAGIWRRSISIDLEFCDVQDLLIKTKSQGNNIPNGNPDAFMDYCSWYMQQMGVSQDKYDLAHYISASGGGGLGACCACESYKKCMGGTALQEPIGDPFDVDFVAHEMGHQFNHLHTFAGAKGNCGSNFYPGESVELGSGRTILSYAGICGSDNTQMNSAPYFASVSLGIYAKTQYDNSYKQGIMQTCGTVTQTTNNRPTASTLAACAVPRLTPFVLKGTGTDPDANTVLTYNWEQIDAAAQATPLDTESQDGPIFVSVSPSTHGHTRYFPALDTAIRSHVWGTVDQLERLSTFQRDLHFTMTVRDRYNGPGGGAHDTAIGTWHLGFTTVSVSEVGPLTVTSPMNGPLQTGETTVRWRLMNAEKSGLAAELIKRADYRLEIASCSSTIDECMSSEDWQDDFGEGCRVYTLQNYCTPSGGTGSGWSILWGEMDVISAGPIKEKPSEACCGCGGGTRKSVCSPRRFVPLRGLHDETTWKMSEKGIGKATVSIPKEFAGNAMFRVIAGASNDNMDDDIYCKYYALSNVINFTMGPTDNNTVVRTIPADNATNVANTKLEVVFILSRASALSPTAASKEIVVRNGDIIIKAIAGNSTDVQILGSMVTIIIGDVGSYEVTVVVPAFLLEDLPAQMITFSTQGHGVATMPGVISVMPTPNSIGISQNSTINITISPDAIPGVGSVRLSVYDEASMTTVVLCTVPAKEMVFAQDTLSFNMQDELCWLYSDTITFVEVEKTAVFNPIGGLTLPENFTFSFRAWVDTIRPNVFKTHPLENSSHVSEGDFILVYYDEDIYPNVNTGDYILVYPIDETRPYGWGNRFERRLSHVDMFSLGKVFFYVAEVFVGVMVIVPQFYFMPRTTYRVIVPEGAIYDWNGNLGFQHVLTFRTGDIDAPYCKNVTVSQAADGRDVVITMHWEHWWSQFYWEPSSLVRGSRGIFWLEHLIDNTSDIISISVADSARVLIDRLRVTIAFPFEELTAGAQYTFRWPDNILYDDYQNAVFKWSDSINHLCNATNFIALGTTASTSLESAEPKSSTVTYSTATSTLTASPSIESTTTSVFGSTSVTVSTWTSTSPSTSTLIPTELTEFASSTFASTSSTMRQVREVRGSFTITTNDATSFASSDNVKASLQQAIADNHANMEAEWVEILNVTVVRRLSDERRLAGNVIVDYKITIPSSAHMVTPTTESMHAIQNNITSSLNHRLLQNGVVGITITSVVANEVTVGIVGAIATTRSETTTPPEDLTTSFDEISVATTLQSTTITSSTSIIASTYEIGASSTHVSAADNNVEEEGSQEDSNMLMLVGLIVAGCSAVVCVALLCACRYSRRFRRSKVSSTKLQDKSASVKGEGIRAPVPQSPSGDHSDLPHNSSSAADPHASHNTGTDVVFKNPNQFGQSQPAVEQVTPFCSSAIDCQTVGVVRDQVLVDL